MKLRAMLVINMCKLHKLSRCLLALYFDGIVHVTADTENDRCYCRMVLVQLDMYCSGRGKSKRKTRENITG